MEINLEIIGAIRFIMEHLPFENDPNEILTIITQIQALKITQISAGLQYLYNKCGYDGRDMIDEDTAIVLDEKTELLRKDINTKIRDNSVKEKLIYLLDNTKEF